VDVNHTGASIQHELARSGTKLFPSLALVELPSRTTPCKVQINPPSDRPRLPPRRLRAKKFLCRHCGSRRPGRKESKFKLSPITRFASSKLPCHDHDQDESNWKGYFQPVQEHDIASDGDIKP